MKISKHSIIVSTITAVAAIGISLVPSNSMAQRGGGGFHGKVSNSKSHIITSFEKNAQRLDFMAQAMVKEARYASVSTKRRGYSSQSSYGKGGNSHSSYGKGNSAKGGSHMTLKALSNHAQLTNNLVRATRGSNPMAVRQSVLAVDYSIKNLQKIRSHSIKSKVDASAQISSSLVRNMREFNLAKNTPVKVSPYKPVSNSYNHSKPQKVVVVKQEPTVGNLLTSLIRRAIK